MMLSDLISDVRDAHTSENRRLEQRKQRYNKMNTNETESKDTLPRFIYTNFGHQHQGAQSQCRV